MIKVLLISEDNLQHITIELNDYFKKQKQPIVVNWNYLNNYKQLDEIIVIYIASNDCSLVLLINEILAKIEDIDFAKMQFEPPTKPFEKKMKKISENLKNLEDISPKNNGGETDYYALPRPSSKEIRDYLEQVGMLEDYIPEFITWLYDFFPKTLNDLIEYKNMPFWRGEIFKACYGLEGRMLKNKEPEQAERRELNKIIYYANRRLKQLDKV